MAHKWSERENEMLFSLTGDMPWSAVVKAYHRWATAEKFPYRTEKALLRRVHVYGYSAKAVGEWLDPPAIGQLLGIGGNQVRRWIVQGWIRGHQEGVKWYISRKDLRDLAKRRPDLFQDRPETNLMQLLCDSALAKQLSKSSGRLRLGKGQKIRCLETGRTYNSMADAAEKIFVVRQTLSKAMREGRPCAGYSWKFVA